MSRFKGKYYWVKTENGTEIGYQRYSGQWELCGISEGEDINNEILEVLGEVANGIDSSDKQCNIDVVVGRSEQCEHEPLHSATEMVDYCPKCRLYQPSK